MPWFQGYEAILPYVFKIETPSGYGTSTFVGYNKTRTAFAFVTAWHVIQHADTWKEPIKLTQESTGKTLYLTDEIRVIIPSPNEDSAGMLIFAHEFDLPENPLRLMERDQYKKIGTEVGWVGYPGIALPYLCFFCGRISAYVKSNESYFIDGVAIHGVSGGPVFGLLQDSQPELLGTVSSYRPNRLMGETLPGMLCAQDVTPLHSMFDTIKNVDEARERKAAEAAKQAEVAKLQNPGTGTTHTQQDNQ